MTTATVDRPHAAPVVSAGMTALSRAIRQVAVEDVATVDDVTLGERLRELRRIAGALDGEFARTLAVFDARAAGRADGAATTQAWLRWRTRLHPREAHQRVVVARALGDLPATAGALADGTVSHGHAVVIASTAADVGPEHARVAEPILLEAARTMDPGALRRLATRIRYAVDADGVLGDAEKAFDRRRLHLSSTFGGMVVLDGLFDPESGATLMAALTAMSPPAESATSGARGRPRPMPSSNWLAGPSTAGSCPGSPANGRA